MVNNNVFKFIQYIMEINIILLTPDALMLGFQYHKPEKGFDFTELNLYFTFFQLQFRW